MVWKQERKTIDVVNMATSSSEACIEDLVSKPNAKSTVWMHFGFVPNEVGQPKNPSEAICKLCAQRPRKLPSPVSCKGSNTSNLFSHLKVHHPSTFAEIQQARTMEVRGKVNSQPTTAESMSGATIYAHNSKKWQTRTDAISWCLAKDMLPLYSVNITNEYRYTAVSVFIVIRYGKNLIPPSSSSYPQQQQLVYSRAWHV